MKGKMVFISCDSGFRHNNLGLVYEYDVQDIPLTMCNLNLGLEERLEHINDGFGEFSKEVDCIDFKFNICEAKLKAIHSLLSHYLSSSSLSSYLPSIRKKINKDQ